ncbi:MAG: EAL domain-containing protein [Methylobacterium frigidaeris]
MIAGCGTLVRRWLNPARAVPTSRGAEEPGGGAAAEPTLASRIRFAQFVEIKKQIPALYACLTVNALALAYTHSGLAPVWLTAGVAGALVAVCILRACHWYRLDVRCISAAEATRRMRQTFVLTGIMAFFFVIWAITLDGYGGAFERGHVTIFMAVTLIACIFCLMHLPPAAMLVTVIVSAVFLPHYVLSGNAVFMAIALNIAFVNVVMVRVLLNNFRSFLTLIEFQTALIDKQDEMRILLDENVRLAHTDSLTGLPNRRSFFSELEALCRAPRPPGGTIALAIFDLDRFKPINDTYGHASGDRLLIEAAERVRAFAGDGVRVARLGGDKFGLLIEVDRLGRPPAAFCREVAERLKLPVRIGDVQLSPGCSGGLALSSEAGREADALFEQADHALAYSKEHRRGTVTLYSKHHDDLIQDGHRLEAALQTACFEDEFELHYQPILDLASRRIVLVEALARWTSPTLGPVSPARFIPAAERCGMVHTLTLALLARALRDLGELPPEVGLSFNLSSHDLISPETTGHIVDVVGRGGVAPRRLTFELTETALMMDFDAAEASIRTLRQLGSRIALDDFGTGYSSLSYVHRLGLDKIKIDRSFTAGLGTRTGESIVRTIFDLCANLGLECIAEGVETDAQLDRLRDFGCHLVQGYLIGKAMPMHLLRDHPMLAWSGPSPAAGRKAASA